MRAVVFAYSNVGDRCLRVLRAGGVDVSLVVTHRDAPGETLWFQRVADTASELGLDTFFGDGVCEAELLGRVEAARPDVIFSFYYRAMLPPSVLALARAGAFNMHGSLLPKYRGRAPTNWAVLRGETETGATLHAMVAKPDAGAIVEQVAVPILPDDTGRQVFDKVTVAAEQVLWRSLPAIIAGNAPQRVNDVASGSYFGGRRPEDGRIDWSRPAAEVYNLLRAVAPPYPGAFTDVAGARLIVAKARRPLSGRHGPHSEHGREHEHGRADPRDPGIGTTIGLHTDGERIVALCGDGGRIDIHELSSPSGPVTAAALRTLLDSHRSAERP